MQISHNIRTIRENKGLKIVDVAEKLGVSRTTYSNWENETEPTIAVIKQIADVFGVHYIEIIEGYGASMPDIKPRPDIQFNFSMSATELDNLKASLNVLGKVFSSEHHLKTERLAPAAGIEQLRKNEGNKKPPSSKVAKG